MFNYLLITQSILKPSPVGEGWMRGKLKSFVLFTSPQPSPSGEGAKQHYFSDKK